MDGDGGSALTQQQLDSDSFSLPAVLAQLDTADPDEQRAAVETIRETVETNPTACVPTVPKLRAVLENDTLECHETVAYCLAELAAESPADVAPSVDTIVAFVTTNPTQPATAEALRCLAALAADQPATVAGHVASIAAVIDQRPGHAGWGVRTLRTLSKSMPSAVAPAMPVLIETLSADPEATGTQVLPIAGRLAQVGDLFSPLEVAEYATELVDHEDDALRRNAIGCLGDIAQQYPTAVEPACSALVSALESDDPATRANAAVVFARVAEETTTVVESAQEPLVALLTDDHDRVRTNACVALGHGRVARARHRLERIAREDSEESVRERAEWALEELS